MLKEIKEFNDKKDLMEMVKKGDLKLYKSSGSSRTGVTSRVYKDMEIVAGYWLLATGCSQLVTSDQQPVTDI